MHPRNKSVLSQIVRILDVRAQESPSPRLEFPSLQLWRQCRAPIEASCKRPRTGAEESTNDQGQPGRLIPSGGHEYREIEQEQTQVSAPRRRVGKDHDHDTFYPDRARNQPCHYDHQSCHTAGSMSVVHVLHCHASFDLDTIDLAPSTSWLGPGCCSADDLDQVRIVAEPPLLLHSEV
ncbi:hypothetical protein PENSPDRAFT_242134 [Peniophora sp. CONT]|nr:hypothetical protein PENSPDRAFT_242134 [Peniophora sp. CONT]